MPFSSSHNPKASSSPTMHSLLHSPISGDLTLRRKSGRTPLQPKNSLTEIHILKPKPRGDSVQLSKENNPICAAASEKLVIEPRDASLAEELSAIRKKMERLKAEKEKTEKMLSEKSRLLDLQMKEMEQRGEIQKGLEIEVDRLYRLKQLHSTISTSISPLRSLREREQEKQASQGNQRPNSNLQKGEEEETMSVGSPCISSCSSSKSIPSQIVAVK